jgi:hypothetical protein
MISLGQSPANLKCNGNGQPLLAIHFKGSPQLVGQAMHKAHAERFKAFGIEPRRKAYPVIGYHQPAYIGTRRT